MSEKNTNKYAIVDLEATSASSTASIIQVGIVIMQNGQVIDEFASDVNPHQELDDHIIHLTGITDQQLAQAPDFSEIARTIFELIEDCILVVDDEEDLCEILKFNLENEGYEVDTANSAEEALKMNISSYHLLLLDVMMGEISGFKMANILKKDKKTAQVPIIFITAKDTENDTVTGFNLGADDYISKPFSLREVIARVKAVLRRTATSDMEKVPEQLSYQSLVIDITKKKVSIDGEEVPLTKKEFEILFLLLQNKGRVFSREDILSRIWSDEVYVLDRTIDVNITRLRKKIGIYGKRIVTRLGYGYCFETE